MFNNFINLSDFVRLIAGIKHGYLSAIISRLFRVKKARVKEAWKIDAKGTNGCTAWWVIPEVKKRWNKLISGDEDVDYYQYISTKYLSDKQDLRGLSLACGTGFRELHWVQLCDFKKIEAYDISPSEIEIARKRAGEKNYQDTIDYQVADVSHLALSDNAYDAVFVEQSLHHFSPLNEILKKINRTLKMDGYFILDEFVGPTRFQWTDRQREIVNGILKLLPRKYKTIRKYREIKKKVYQPSRLSMMLKDPSEAVESSRIMPLLEDIFEIVEIKPYGGTILNLLFDGIADNFLDADTQTKEYLKLCFEMEDLFLSSGDIKSDFAVIICRRKT